MTKLEDILRQCDLARQRDLRDTPRKYAHIFELIHVDNLPSFYRCKICNSDVGDRLSSGLVFAHLRTRQHKDADL